MSLEICISLYRIAQDVAYSDKYQPKVKSIQTFKHTHDTKAFN